MIHFKQTATDCWISGVSAKSLAETYNTPFYVYDAESIRQQYMALNAALNTSCDIFYSFKANPNMTICDILRTQGAGAEVCSLIELEIALMVGYKPKDIIFVGPAKTEHDLRACITNNIFAIVAESVEELQLINMLAKVYHKQVSVMLRINPNFSLKKASLKMGGKASQFGIDYAELLQREQEILAFDMLNIIGIHVYNGTRNLDASAFIENSENIFNLALELMYRWNITFQCIDLGGGIGVPYFDNEQAFSLAAINSNFTQMKNTILGDYPQIRIILESGRYLLAESGVFISQVISKKKSKGTSFLITDGGTNCHMAAVGLNSAIKRNFPILLLRDGYCSHEYHITGPLCTPGDLLGKDVLLPETHPGDLIAILKAGAYGPTASPTLFLSHGFPAEILIDKGVRYLIRNHDDYDNVLGNQNLIRLN